MAHSSFGPAWPNCDRSRWRTLTRADGLRIPVHVELVDLTAMLMDLTELSGLDIIPGWTWGAACRAISGTNVPSNHSQATATDVNAPANPYASASYHSRNANTTVRGKRLITQFNSDIVKMWEDHGFRWGGWYVSKPDTMHFEFMGTVDDARRYTANLRAFLAGNGKPAPKPPAPVTDPQYHVQTPGILQNGDHHPEVGKWQRFLTDVKLSPGPVDNHFGTRTEEATKVWQRKLKIDDDGKVGPETREATKRLFEWLAANGEVERTKELQRLVRVKDDGDFGPITTGACKRHMVSWKKRGAGITNEHAIVEWLQKQGNRRWKLNMSVDGKVGPQTNHLIVVCLGQSDGICGPNGFREAVR